MAHHPKLIQANIALFKGAPGLVNLALPFEQGTQVFDLIRERPDDVAKYAIRFD